MDTMMDTATVSCKITEEYIRKTAEEGFAAIKARDDKERASKKIMESYGVFDNIDAAALSAASKSDKSEYPLYIKAVKEKDETRYEVKEFILKDADGVPIHNGDAIFLPNDTFFRIQFTSSIPTENDSLIDKIFYRGIAEEGYEEFFPEKLKEYPIQTFHLDNNYVKSLFRVRMWTDAEKLEYLKNRAEQVTITKYSEIKNFGIDAVVSTAMAFCFGFLLFCFFDFWDESVRILFGLPIMTGGFNGFVSLILYIAEVIMRKKEKEHNEEKYCCLNNLTSEKEINKTVFQKEIQRIQDNLPTRYRLKHKLECKPDVIQSSF